MCTLCPFFNLIFTLASMLPPCCFRKLFRFLDLIKNCTTLAACLLSPFTILSISLRFPQISRRVDWNAIPQPNQQSFCLADIYMRLKARQFSQFITYSCPKQSCWGKQTIHWLWKRKITRKNIYPFFYKTFVHTRHKSFNNIELKIISNKHIVLSHSFKLEK